MPFCDRWAQFTDVCKQRTDFLCLQTGWGNCWKTLVNTFNTRWHKMDITEASRRQIIISAVTPKGSPLSHSCLVKTLAAMIGMNPSPSSQFVPAHFHKTQRDGEVSRDRAFKVWFWMAQGASPCSWLEADSSYCTNCLEPCLCECNWSLEIPYRLRSS